MKTWERWLDAGKKLLHRSAEPKAPLPGPSAQPTPPTLGGSETEFRRGLTAWVENRAQKVVKQAYESHAEDLEQRAMRVMNSVYEQSADDMEVRATRALRRAIETEAERIKDAIEHGIEIKKREVRLSLLVLVVSSLVYLVLYWITNRPPAS